jgi:2,4-dienoyl-CoA reductase-like NADH-dependent reductase (Old Yellow Enzyme family)
MTALFSPLRLRGLEISNRITVSPMCQYSATDGSAADWHLMHLGKFAVSGVGMLIIEATHVEARGRITPGCLGLYSDANEAALARIVAFCKEHGFARIGMQLSHSGRKGSARLPWEERGAPLTAKDGAWPTVGTSGQPFAEGWPTPTPLDTAGLEIVKTAHVDAARRADRIGIDVIELHAAHGYLLHEFMSPISNRRNDTYGGPLQNRIRYVLETFEAVRTVWPNDKPMGTRISATDWIDGGWTLDDAVVLCRELRALGCDYITVSSGGLSPAQKVPIGEGHQVELAARIRRDADIPVIAVGMIYRPAHAEQIIADGHADMVALARGMLFDPHWTWRAAAELGAQVPFPPQYVRAYKSAWLQGQAAGGDGG